MRVYLNDLYRARAERAGVVFIDVWDGFVDDAGKFSSFGPDYEGQMRRLRSNDGVFFTNYGARKLAHYVEREIRRYMSNRSLQVALPTGPVAVPNGKSAARPVAGPVVPLTVSTGTTDELLGGAGTRPRTAIPSPAASWSTASRSTRSPDAPTISPGRAASRNGVAPLTIAGPAAALAPRADRRRQCGKSSRRAPRAGTKAAAKPAQPQAADAATNATPVPPAPVHHNPPPPPRRRPTFQFNPACRSR